MLRDKLKLGELYEACMANSDSLLRSAMLLEGNGYYAQGFFLALTAWEEIGKAQVVADYSEDCVSRDEFDKAFRKHSLKMAYLSRKVELTTNGKMVTDATITYDIDRGRELAEWREHALYVSLGQGLDSFSPNSQISDKQCKNIIREVEEYTAYLRHMEHVTERIGIKSLTK